MIEARLTIDIFETPRPRAVCHECRRRRPLSAARRFVCRPAAAVMLRHERQHDGLMPPPPDAFCPRARERRRA